MNGATRRLAGTMRLNRFASVRRLRISSRSKSSFRLDPSTHIYLWNVSAEGGSLGGDRAGSWRLVRGVVVEKAAAAACGGRTRILCADLHRLGRARAPGAA